MNLFNVKSLLWEKWDQRFAEINSDSKPTTMYVTKPISVWRLTEENVNEIEQWLQSCGYWLEKFDNGFRILDEESYYEAKVIFNNYIVIDGRSVSVFDKLPPEYRNEP